jgi:hypothetical protein
MPEKRRRRQPRRSRSAPCARARARVPTRPPGRGPARKRQCPETVMGAGIAAGPHCPGAGSLPGRRGVQRWAVSSRRRRNRGFPRRFLRGPLAGRGRLRGFPAGSPTGPKPWRFAARRFGICTPPPPFRHSGRGRSPGKDGVLGRSLGSAWRSISRSFGSRRFRSSRAEARSCPVIRSRSSSFPVAAREPKFRFPPGGSPGPKAECTACRLPDLPEGRPVAMWALHEACRFRIR